MSIRENELTVKQTLEPTDFFRVVTTDGYSRKLPSSAVTNLKGVSGIEKTGTSGLVDTYTITYTNGDTDTFEVTNGAEGNGIQSITKTGTAGNVDTYTITYTNGQTTTFTVTNATFAVQWDSGNKKIIFEY